MKKIIYGVFFAAFLSSCAEAAVEWREEAARVEESSINTRFDSLTNYLTVRFKGAQSPLPDRIYYDYNVFLRKAGTKSWRTLTAPVVIDGACENGYICLQHIADALPEGDYETGVQTRTAVGGGERDSDVVWGAVWTREADEE